MEPANGCEKVLCPTRKQLKELKSNFLKMKSNIPTIETILSEDNTSLNFYFTGSALNKECITVNLTAGF